MVTDSSNDVLVLRRTYAAAPELVFQFWTTPEYMQRWFRPNREYKHQFIEVDLRVGGRYHIAFESQEGKVDVLGGEFLEVTPPSRLVYSWTWEEPNENAGIETQVTVEFLENGGGTELVLTHERFPKAEMKEHHMAGWSGALDQLEESVTQS
ncbi:MAG: SRPBCC domain-containing protein [Planctomycetes bacterium]|nr:SRPBCC domain-containing protein [Planctomycetota bacterium]MCH9725845.1 SRPBCC domain-containing protein [Planctomycetota bacterium]MCH9775409.1 SRPBCC domain-containing protein [Planctomycetota bacterium]MCH9790270.1 SRPBCC domain-containing protein [Planctomycetota bacterium]MDF1743795.1 SRPBCC domain-containing protein [Gimesia sp.]